MTLYTQDQYKQLVLNGSAKNVGKDHKPVVKWFAPETKFTWLITKIFDPQTAFGLVDLGNGDPEIRYISMDEINRMSRYLGVAIERDHSFVPKYPISVYLKAAQHGFINSDAVLKQAAKCVRIEKSIIRIFTPSDKG